MMLWEIKEELCLYEGQKYRHTAVGNFVGYVYAKVDSHIPNETSFIS
jgi:hypothetical protein